MAPHIVAFATTSGVSGKMDVIRSVIVGEDKADNCRVDIRLECELINGWASLA